MTRWVLAGFAVLAGLLAATTPMADIRAPARQPALYGVSWQGSLGLVRVDPDTLRPLCDKRVPIAGEPSAWSFAPNRSRLALGSTARGARLRLIDLRAMRAATSRSRGAGPASPRPGQARGAYSPLW